MLGAPDLEFNEKIYAGQVQDVGLIFLSAMATSIADEGHKKGLPTREILGTTLITVTLSTFLVGVLIVLVGALRYALLRYITFYDFMLSEY